MIFGTKVTRSQASVNEIQILMLFSEELYLDLIDRI